MRLAGDAVLLSHAAVWFDGARKCVFPLSNYDFMKRSSTEQTDCEKGEVLRFKYERQIKFSPSKCAIMVKGKLFGWKFLVNFENFERCV